MLRCGVSKEGDHAGPVFVNLSPGSNGADLLRAGSIPAQYTSVTYLGRQYQRGEFNSVPLTDGAVAFVAASKATNGN